jgi:hypothetical protein
VYTNCCQLYCIIGSYNRLFISAWPSQTGKRAASRAFLPSLCYVRGVHEWHGMQRRRSSPSSQGSPSHVPCTPRMGRAGANAPLAFPATGNSDAAAHALPPAPPCARAFPIDRRPFQRESFCCLILSQSLLAPVGHVRYLLML